MTCVACSSPIEPGRPKNTRRCWPCWRARNRAKAKAWYNRDPEKTLARAKVWVAAHRESNRIYQREWKRARRPAKACETLTCGKPIEVRQRKFCVACRDFYKQNLWHTFKRRAA